LFHNIASSDECGRVTNKTLFTIIKNMTEETIQTSMILQIRYMIQERAGGLVIDDEGLNEIRKLIEHFIRKYEQFVFTISEVKEACHKLWHLQFLLNKGFSDIQAFDNILSRHIKNYS